MAKRQPEILIDDDVPPNWVGAKAEADAAKAARMADLVYMVAIFVVVYCSVVVARATRHKASTQAVKYVIGLSYRP